ncbi:MAG: DMT family transporter [Gammaproteobacteria bacterium]|nr:DMT family transporter [Gammaproteobacteria bacterium]
MSLPLAYAAIIVIWSTTPLAVKWSAVDAGFVFAVLSRMAIAAVLCQIIAMALRSKWEWHKRALAMYLLSGFNIFFSMILIYWGAQTISSGLIALIFGLMPLVTGVFAAIILKEKSLTPQKLFGISIAFAGLMIIFYSDNTKSDGYILAIISVLTAVIWHSFGTVVFKRFASDLPVMSLTTGGIWVSVFFLTIYWWISDSQIPGTISTIGWGSILYLSVIGSVIGFTIYFYILKNIEASKIALIPLITPVAALLLGQYLNGEQPDARIWTGAFLIIGGLSFYQVGGYLRLALIKISKSLSN